MKGLIATRFSDQKQIGGTSTATQVDVCDKFCQNQGIDIVAYHKVEAESAKSSNVARIAELVEFCKKYEGKASVLVVYKVDRFARDVSQHYYLKTELLKMGISLRSATEPIDNTPQGELMETILAGFAQFDNSVKRERVKLAMWARVDQGLWPWEPPYGYRPNHIDGVKLSPRIIDTSCSETIKSILEEFSTGLVTKAELSRKYKNTIIKTYRGVKLKFSVPAIHYLINNHFYCGLLKNKEGTMIKGLHEPLVSVEMFMKCQQVQKDQLRNINTKRMYLNPDFPLRRFVSCSKCGKQFTACWSKSSKGKRYPYYYCHNKNCIKYSIMIKRSDIENEFSDYLKSIKPTDEFIKKFETRFIDKYEKRKYEIKGDYLNQMEEIKKLENEQQWILEKAKKGLIPDHLIKEQLDDIENKISLIKMKQTETHVEELDVKELLAYAASFIRTLEKNWYDAPFELKLRLQRAIFPEGVIYNYPSYSNSKISPIFETINAFATSSEEDVT